MLCELGWDVGVDLIFWPLLSTTITTTSAKAKAGALQTALGRPVIKTPARPNHPQ